MIYSYLRITKELLITDIMLMQKKLKNTIIDTLIWVSSVTAISTYILPQLGIQQAYGPMVLIGTIVSCAVFECFGNTSTTVSDLDGDRTITYQLTLPLPGWLLLVQKALYFALHSAVLTLFILPTGKLIMGSNLDLAGINPFKFALAFIGLHVMCGFFGIIMISYTPNMNLILSVWTRLLFPLWFFGGSQFNWYTLKDVSPIIAYINLCNPLTYAFEGIKNAALRDGQFLNFWLCIGMMLIFSIIFACMGNYKMKRRLDYI